MPDSRADAVVLRVVPVGDKPYRTVLEPRTDEFVDVVTEVRREGSWRETGREVALSVAVEPAAALRWGGR